MDEKIDSAIEKVLGMIRVNMNPDEAMKVSQAALNLAHAKQLLKDKSPKKQEAAA
jgi:hypothetical protein